MSKQELPGFIADLHHPERFDHEVEGVSLIQTHISNVLVAGEYVYKFKKPVDFGFLDFTTLEKRGEYCQKELELNRRLCPDIYLDVVTVTRSGDAFALNGSGEVVEYGVRMVRLPEERMMGHMLSAGMVERQHLVDIVETLVPFYQKADGSEMIQGFGTAESVGVNVLENFEQTESYVGGQALSRDQFDRIRSYATEVLADTARFAERIGNGRIRDCHGDLYSANICLAEKVQIFDCIEFNERFRYSDVAADVAFLAMDLDYHGQHDLADFFIEHFAQRSGDPALLAHIGFYKCYRAYVRGKIGLFTAADPLVPQELADRCVAQARNYFQLAERYAREDS